jgi:hypothetical protein
MRRPQPRTAAAAITALLAGLALAGCTSGAAQDTPAGDTGTASAPGPDAAGQPSKDLRFVYLCVQLFVWHI